MSVFILFFYSFRDYKSLYSMLADDISARTGGRFAYVMSDLSGKVTVFRYDDGRLETLQEIVSDSVGARGGADIHISPDGKFLYSSNRLKAD